MDADLFGQMTRLVVESKQQGLFTHYETDFYQNDKDTIEHDFQNGDSWLFRIKQCGTTLVLITPHSEYVSAALSDISPEHRYFIVSVQSTGSTITEYAPSDIKQAVSQARYITNRKPRREYCRPLMERHWPSLYNSVLYSDMSFAKGEDVFFSVTNNSLSYVIPSRQKARTLPLPFDLNRPTGYFKLTVTSSFGHAEMVASTVKGYNHAIKKSSKACKKAA
jgi:hypothetical protein